jgi:ubiquitin
MVVTGDGTGVRPGSLQAEANRPGGQVDTIKEGYAKKFASKNQDEIGQDAICELCGLPVKITDFRTAEALEIYCCGCGNDEGFCQTCQDL